MHIQPLGQEYPLEDSMATHSRILVWRIPWWATVHRVAELDTTEVTWHACTHKLTANQKIMDLKCHLLLFCMTTNHFLIGLWCAMKSGLYMTTKDDQLSGWIKKLQSTFQSQTWTKKKSHGHCLVVCCPSDPLQPPESPGKPLHVRSMLSNWWYTGNCNACSWHWATEGAQFCTTMPNCSLHNQHFKSWTNWTRKFCLIHHIHLTSRQPTTTSSSILTTFCRENTPTTSMRHKMLSKSSLKPKAWIFMLQE